MLQALHLLSDDIPNLKLTIIGAVQEQKYADEVVKLSRGLNVELTGFLSNQSDEFREHLANADLGIVPSIVDNQPNVVLEMLSFGLPVIASNVGAIPQMVTRRVGSLVPPGDAGALALEINKLYVDRPRLNDMIQCAISHVENNFTWRTSAERHIDLFHRLQDPR